MIKDGSTGLSMIGLLTCCDEGTILGTIFEILLGWTASARFSFEESSWTESAVVSIIFGNM